ncbi:Fe2+-enterobactin ABC transporter substrate-binding protein (plasmid) [Rhizobium sp. ACO-34A]|nr:Fe2+-enterobactin ABC transporter substrate-binding protein [Rhizobium sp. ACO-34A]
MKPLKFLFAALAVIIVTDTARAEDGTWPRTVKHAAGELTIEKKPLRIVSTTPSLTGILLAIEAPVIATAATTPSILTDDKGFFSQWAEVADERGVKTLYSNLNFDIEAVIGAEPDLLIASATGADSVLQHYAELTAQGVPTLVVDYSNQSWQEIAIELGKALGLEKEAAASIARFDAYAAEAAKTIKPPAGPVSIVAYDIGSTYSVGRPESPQGQLLQALGLKVAGLPEELRPQITRRSDFEFISRENLPAAVQTESVFLLRGTEKDVAAFLADPVLANRAAVKNRQVYPLGPSSFRIDYYSGRQMIDAVAQALKAP